MKNVTCCLVTWTTKTLIRFIIINNIIITAVVCHVHLQQYIVAMAEPTALAPADEAASIVSPDPATKVRHFHYNNNNELL